jgi:hypothetical protein
MNRLQVMTKLVEAATVALEAKKRQVRPHLRRAVFRELNLRQAAVTEQDLERAMVPVFKRQIERLAGKLGSGKKKNLLDEKQATRELVESILPILAVRMAEAARNQMLSMGLDFRGRGKKSGPLQAKTTSATDWLMDQDNEDLADLIEELSRGFPNGLPIRLATEIPRPMRERIVRELRQSFHQSYWEDIAATTAGDANRILEAGLQDGLSIRDIAARLRESLGEEYYKNRAVNIARTEAGNALNGARRGVIDQLKEDLGDRVPMRPVWLSVLGNTTRDTHADLDGVPADGNGMWRLSGYEIPWPGHFSLPASERCNCRCSIFTELGLRDDEAERLIQDYEDREEAATQNMETKTGRER